MRKILNIEQIVDRLYKQVSPASYRWKPDMNLSSQQRTQLYQKNKGYCYKCGGRLHKVGHQRKNGKNHPDWDTRKLHKKCWRKRKFGSCRENENQEQVQQNFDHLTF